MAWGDKILVLHNQVRLRKALLYITKIGAYVGGYIASLIKDTGGFSLRMYTGSIGLQSMARMKDSRQYLVFDLDQFECLFCNVWSVGSHDSHAVTNITKNVIQTVAVL